MASEVLHTNVHLGEFGRLTYDGITKDTNISIRELRKIQRKRHRFVSNHLRSEAEADIAEKLSEEAAPIEDNQKIVPKKRKISKTLAINGGNYLDESERWFETLDASSVSSHEKAALKRWFSTLSLPSKRMFYRRVKAMRERFYRCSESVCENLDSLLYICTSDPVLASDQHIDNRTYLAGTSMKARPGKEPT